MVFITGDTHGSRDLRKLGSRAFPVQKFLTKSDVVIILGDFGLLFDPTPAPDEIYWLNWLENKPWTTLFLSGNHDNHRMINELREIPMFGDVVGKVQESVYHLKTGHIYTICGKTFLVIGGAESIDRYIRTEGIDYWPEELLTYKQQEEIFDTIRDHPNVDYVLSHTCPTSVFQGFGLNPQKRNDPTMKILEEVRVRLHSFKEWYFGHFHFDRFMRNGFQCLYECVLPLQF